MNFTGVRDSTAEKHHYEKVLAYIISIQKFHPGLDHQMLIQAPQTEYEVEICRKKPRFARQYLQNLVGLVRAFERMDFQRMNFVNG